MARRWLAMALTAVGLGVVGCAGGGSSPGPLANGSIPPPPPPAVPLTAGSEPVELLATPSTQQFATAGAALQIRYDAASGKYEVNPGSDWRLVVDDPNSFAPSGRPNQNFGFDANQNYLAIRAHYASPAPETRYRYSNLAVWGSRGGPPYSLAFTAFGAPTPTGAVPRAGSAAYSGMIEGKSTYEVFYPLDGGMVAASITGTVNLQFDFAAGTLSGDLRATEYAASQISLPTLTFTNTVYATGSPTFSGRFATSVPGQNAFSGQFTGPGAEELIGAFTFPYLQPVNGSVQQATGAMIAKR